MEQVRIDEKCSLESNQTCRRKAQIQKVIGIYDGKTGPGVVFETGLNGVCRCVELKRKDSWKKWRPIDSNVTNATKCFEAK